MEKEEKNGVNHYYDFEIEKAFKQYRYGVPIADFFRIEAKAYRYGKKGYIGKLKEELEHFEEQPIFIDDSYDYQIECVEELKNAILDLQKLNTEPPTKQFETSLTDTQRSKLFDLLLSRKYIAPSTNKESFIWAFGGKIQPSNWQPIKWIDKSKTRHEHNMKTLYELLYLLGVDKDTSAKNPNNLYRKMEFCFDGLVNIAEKNPSKIEQDTDRKRLLKTIIEEVEKVEAQK